MCGPERPGLAVESRAPPREVVCVAFVDVAGFSQLMHADEHGAFQRWSGLRDGIVLPALARHGGTYVKNTGDGILATFPSALAGARWALEVQRRARAERQVLVMRIALNLCPVIPDGTDVAGDGVNIAARLQEHAPVGGIILTEAMHAALADYPDMPIRGMGSLRLRKLSMAVTAWALVTDGRAFAASPPGIDHAQVPSIAVLPLANLGGDPADDYFAAGIVEDIVLSLSNLKELTVISRSSTLAFARQNVDAKTIGQVLGVHYVVTGTLHRAAGRLRISTELVDAGSGEVIFTERHQFGETDLFDIQDAIVEATVLRVVPGLQAAERRRALRKRPESFTAYDLTLRALDQIGSLERTPFEEAYGFLDSAIARDPGYAAPLAWSARWHSLRVGQGWSPDPGSDQREAAARAMQAIRLDEHNALALATYGHVQSYLFGDFETGIGYLDRARDTGPNSAVAWLLSSITLGCLGRADESREAVERALRLSPFDQHLFMYYSIMGLAHYDGGDYEQAVSWLYRAHAENPRYTSNLRILAVSLAAAGRLQEAQGIVGELREMQPGFRMATYRRTLRPYADETATQLFYDRLRLAGAPE